jgi:hypothetical protein
MSRKRIYIISQKLIPCYINKYVDVSSGEHCLQGIIALAPKINISGPTRNTNTADNLSDNTYMDLVVTVKTNK